MAKVQEGTLIHGTLLARDLIPAFAAELRRLGKTAPRMPPNPSAAWYDSEQTDFVLEELQDRLQNVAAEHGLRFGAHEGDGADFGYWYDQTEGLD